MIEDDFEKQEKFLEDNKKVVKEQAYFMKQAIDSLNTRDALRHSALMINELKTSLLTAKNYFMLWQMVYEELRILELHFKDEYKRGRRMV